MRPLGGAKAPDRLQTSRRSMPNPPRGPPPNEVPRPRKTLGGLSGGGPRRRGSVETTTGAASGRREAGRVRLGQAVLGRAAGGHVRRRRIFRAKTPGAEHCIGQVACIPGPASPVQRAMVCSHVIGMGSRRAKWQGFRRAEDLGGGTSSSAPGTAPKLAATVFGSGRVRCPSGPNVVRGGADKAPLAISRHSFQRAW